MRFSLDPYFPLLTTKKVFWKSIVHELLWFISGSTNVKYLQENGVKIWDEWADENGELGPVYGKQWRDFGGVDQLAQIVDQLKNNPNSRRIIVSAWNVPEIPQMNLPPCHMTFQFFVVNGKLSCQLYQRSCDVFLGVPFNIASYSLLTHMLAQVTGLKAHEFIWTGGDVHIYQNHFEQVEEQLARDSFPPPKIKLNPEVKSIFDFKYEDVELIDYQCHPYIKAPIAV